MLDKQGLYLDVRFMQQVDKLLYFLFLRRTAVLRGKRQVDLINLMRAAEVAQSFAPGGKVE